MTKKFNYSGDLKKISFVYLVKNYGIFYVNFRLFSNDL